MDKKKVEPIRQGHKYLCPICKKSFFTKEEAQACIQKHEQSESTPS